MKPSGLPRNSVATSMPGGALRQKYMLRRVVACQPEPQAEDEHGAQQQRGRDRGYWQKPPDPGVQRLGRRRERKNRRFPDEEGTEEEESQDDTRVERIRHAKADARDCCVRAARCVDPHDDAAGDRDERHDNPQRAAAAGRQRTCAHPNQATRQRKMQSREQHCKNQIVVVDVRHQADRAREGQRSRNGRLSLVTKRRQQHEGKAPGRQEVQVSVKPAPAETACRRKRSRRRPTIGDCA